MPKKTAKEEGYIFIRWLWPKRAVFLDTNSGVKEVWCANRNHASYGFSFNNTDWEYCSTFREEILRSLARQKL